MFDNIGEKIKSLATIITIIGIVISIIVSICLFVEKAVLIGLVVLFCGCLFSWLGMFLLYGFGELIIQTTNIAKGNLRMQMLGVYNESKETSNIPITEQTIEDIKNEIVEDYEYDGNGYVDELDKINIPNKDECPNCFHKIQPTDIECPYCGYKLKI